ncbi:MAG: sensor histidine kinase [Lachnospiraceae bacterium]|nr:sensor histidine kinase [Lachnospiraceae bacterium]
MPEEYLYQWIINLNITCQLVLSTLIFCHPLRRKERYPLWLLLAFAIDAALMVGIVAMRVAVNTLATRFVMRFAQFLMAFAIVMLCYDGSLFVKLKTWCAGIAAMEIGASLFTFSLALFGVDERVTISFRNAVPVRPVDWLVYYILHIGFYLALYYLFGRRKPEELDRSGRSSTILLAMGCLLFLTVPDCISNEFRFVNYSLFLVNRLYLLALAAFIMAICTSIEFQSRYRTDMEILDQVLIEERKQYQQMKENMDVINMRCHDLRHQLDDYADKLTAQEIESLRDAMDFYDSHIKTGCEVLDVVLHVKQPVCRAEHIEMTCLADGECLSFVRTRHLYSLFNNAIGNAIEAVKKLKDPEKRAISVTVERQKELAVIEVTNYFDGRLIPAGATSKSDRSRHGFGTMSMRYIAESYSGKVLTHTEGELYCLRIELPVPKKA